MNPLKKIIEQRARESIPISNDSYQLWRDNECTRRFIADVELMILDVHSDTTTKLDGLRSDVVGVYERILDWKPVELENE